MKQELLDLDLSVAGMPTRALTTLQKAGIRYLAQLLRLQHLREVKGLGRSGTASIRLFLQQKGLSLGQNVGDWSPPGSGRVKKLPAPKDGSLYRILLIGGEKRGMDTLQKHLEARGARISWHWALDKPRQHQKLRALPVGCDVVFRLFDLSRTKTRDHERAAKDAGVPIIQITRKKATWVDLLDDLGLVVKPVKPVKPAPAPKPEPKVHAEVKDFAKKAQEEAKAAQEAERKAREAFKRSNTVPPKLRPKGEYPPKTFKDKPKKKEPTVVVKPTAAPVTPIAKEVMDLVTRNKLHQAIHLVAEKLDETRGTFEELLPYVIAAMQREGIRGLIVTEGGKSVEYTRTTPE